MAGGPIFQRGGSAWERLPRHVISVWKLILIEGAISNAGRSQRMADLDRGFSRSLRDREHGRTNDRCDHRVLSVGTADTSHTAGEPTSCAGGFHAKTTRAISRDVPTSSGSRPGGDDSSLRSPSAATLVTGFRHRVAALLQRQSHGNAETVAAAVRQSACGFTEGASRQD